MNYILLTVSVISTMISGIINSTYGKKKAHNEADFQLLNLISSVFSMVIILITALVMSAEAPSLFTLGLGLVFGTVTALGTVFTVKALSIGPVSYTTLITTASMIIPALSGWAFFNEEIGVVKILGILLMLVSVALSVLNKDEDKRRATAKWLALALTAGAFVGLVGVIQKTHQSSAHSGELMYFLVIAFAFSSIYSAFMLLKKRRKNIKPQVSLSPRKSTVYLFPLLGVTVAISNMINLYLSGVLSSIVFFPVVNGSNLLLMLIVSVVLFRERLSKTQWAGFVIGCGAIALLQ